MSILILILFKNEESDKMSADSAHVQGASGSVSINSLVVSGSHSLTIDVEYVFHFSNIITIFSIISIMRIFPN